MRSSAHAVATLAATGIAVAVCVMGLSSCYLTAQGSRYLGILAGAQPIAKALADPDTDLATKSLLEKAAEVRRFAVEKIGLKDTKSYRSIAKVEGTTLSHVVQACPELSFDRYLWSYPFVGKLPYKGFFDQADAKKEAARLKQQGYDVIVRNSDAFSSLGYLPDPLFSFMVAYDENRLADLLIHEMTHATIFVRGAGAGAFNEELATFVGRQGALDFLAAKYGRESESFRQALAAEVDAVAFSTYLRETARKLEVLYGSDLSIEEKRAGKTRIIAERAEEFARVAPGLFSNPGYARYPMDKIDNALLDLYRLYEGQPERYRVYYEKECDSDLAIFVARLRATKDPIKTLSSGALSR